MRIPDLGTVPLTLFVSVLLALLLLAVRVFVLQRIQSRRQRENRQESERLKSLVAAYRSLAGSFTPATVDHHPQIEETLADLVLFGSLDIVQEAAHCTAALKRGDPFDTQALVGLLRADLRRQLGLDPIPDTVDIPPSGPGRSGRGSGRDGDGGAARGRSGGSGTGGGGGGGAGMAVGAGGVGLGLADSETHQGG
jgi:uncharacterized membrane protein YgcG